MQLCYVGHEQGGCPISFLQNARAFIPVSPVVELAEQATSKGDLAAVKMSKRQARTAATGFPSM